MFTEANRDTLRTFLLERARDDDRITGAAITGSASHGAEDRWSDIDLFFGVADGVVVRDVLMEWSDFMYDHLKALHHFELQAGPATYRAFLLPDGLEIDLGFTPARDFGARGAHFTLVFGHAKDQDAPAIDRDHIVGLAWHHLLHARMSIERTKPWQAEYWIGGVRDHAFTLASLRLGAAAHYAKGVDTLPREITGPFEDTLVRNLDPDELRRALKAVGARLLHELREADVELADRMERTLRELAHMPSSS